LSTTRHRCNLDCVGLGAKPRRWTPLTRDTRKGVLSEYNEALIFFFESKAIARSVMHYQVGSRTGIGKPCEPMLV